MAGRVEGGDATNCERKVRDDTTRALEEFLPPSRRCLSREFFAFAERHLATGFMVGM
jgi:hypothetical protein